MMVLLVLGAVFKLYTTVISITSFEQERITPEVKDVIPS